MNREKQIKKVSWFSILGNAFLSVLKISIGIISGSLAVLADGIDSATDIVASVVTLIDAKIMLKPPDMRFPYGYAKADNIATKVLSFIIFFAGAQLAISTLTDLIEGEVREIPGMLAIYVTLVSIAGKIALAVYQRNMGKKLKSPMLLANGRNMQNDILTSVSVLAGLIFTHLLNLPVIDPVIALLVSVWIMFSAFKIFMESNTELMDGVDDPELYKQLFNAVKEVEGVNNPHRARIRKMGTYYLIAIDIEVDGNFSVDKAHEIANQVEKNVKSKISNVYDILVHIEPIGVVHEQEKFGVSEKDI
jgi:cation diffusion facilitator family transporter